MKIMSALLSSALLVAAPATAQQTAPRADQLAFRDLYKEPVSYTHLDVYKRQVLSGDDTTSGLTAPI